MRETVEPAGVTVEFNGEAEFPPLEQGLQEGLGFLAAFIVLLIVFRTLVTTMIPIALAIVAVTTAFLLLFVLAGLTDINTVTRILVPMIGIGVGIDYSLFIVTRFRQLLHEGLSPRDAAAEARRLRRAGRDLRRCDGGDFSDRPCLLRDGLRHQARHCLGARRPDGGAVASSLLIAVLAKARSTRSIGSRCRSSSRSTTPRLPGKTLIARWGRFVTAHARVVFAVVLLLMLVLAATSALVRFGASRPGHGAGRSDGPQGVRSARRRFGSASTARSRSWST